MSYKEFLTDIEKKQLKRVYLLFGKEMYLKDVIISEIKEKYLDSSFETLNYIHIDGKKTTDDEIINACETLPFMSEKKIVVVEDLDIFKSKSKDESGEREEKQVEELDKYILNMNESTCLIFICKEEKIDSRKKVVKNIKKSGLIVELDKLKGDELERWVSNQFKEHGKKILKNDILYFLTLSSYLEKSTNKTLYDLENEINKIISYIGIRQEVSKEDIDSISSKSLENDIFKLVDFIGQKNTAMAISIFNEMIIGGEPIQKIMYMIVRQVRLLFMTKLLHEKGYSIGTIGQKINVYHNFIVQKLINQGRNFTTEELLNGLKKCVSTDENIKTGKIDGKLGMEVFIVEFSQKLN